MVALIVHAILGIAVIAFIVKSNPAIFKRIATGPQLSTLEIVLWFLGILSLPISWYFNIQYVQQYAENPFWGQPTWSEFIAMGYANPSSSSQVVDYTILSVIMAIWAVVDGRRRGIKKAWLYFGLFLFTSSAFGSAMYLATVERQRRLQPVAAPVDFPA
jgi:Terpene cyclase DEP1